MDVAPQRSERGGTKGTFIVEEAWCLDKGEGSLGVQPLRRTQAEHARRQER